MLTKRNASVSVRLDESGLEMLNITHGDLSFTVWRGLDRLLFTTNATHIDTSGGPGTYQLEFRREQPLEKDGSDWMHSSLNYLVEELDIRKRPMKILAKQGIRYVGQLVQRTEQELLGLEGFGRSSMKDLRSVLADLGLALGMSAYPRVRDWKPPEERNQAP